MGVTTPLPEPALLHLDALPAGTRLAEFELQGLLGVGGFGMVYRAYDHSLQRLVAIKEYMPAALAGRAGGMAVSMRSTADQQGFMAGLKSFLAEARLLAQFDHPSLVKVFRVWEQNNTAYMVMPFYQGMTLKQARAQMRSPPPEAWLRKLLWAVLEALKVLHAHQMVHRDVSPDNIFLQDRGPPVLLDLGAARRAIGDRSQHHTAILKVNYAPIEQYADAEDLRQGPWTDVYSLAAVVHGVLCNDAPLPATFRVLRDRMPSMASVAQTVHEQFGLDYSPAFVQAVSQGLAIQPGDRPQSAVAFGELMRLQPPAGGMERFDWRAELGDIWQAPAAVVELATPAGAAAPEARVPEAPASSERTQAFRPRAAAGAADAAVTVAMPSLRVEPPTAAPAAASRPDRETAPSPRSRLHLWVLGGIGALLFGALAAVGLMALQDGEPDAVAATPDAAAVAIPAETASAPAAADAVAAPLGPVTIEAELRTAAPAAPSPHAPSSVAPTGSGSAMPPGAPVGAVPASMPSLSPPTAVPVPTAPAPPLARAEPPAPALQRLEPARPLTAEQLCPDSNFFTRPMCLYRECQKPAHAAMPVCVENNARLRSDSRNNTP